MLQAYIFEGDPTGHVSWGFGQRYFSFHPGEKRLDLGPITAPLPGGAKLIRGSAFSPALLNTETDKRKYPTPSHKQFGFKMDSFDTVRAEDFANHLFLSDLPYILWDGIHDIGTINCVTTSIMIFAMSMPTITDTTWTKKWGPIFDELKRKSIDPNQVNGWINHTINNPYPQLMYVHQFREMMEDLVAANIAIPVTI